MNNTRAIVMAAGKGTRMKSSVPKVLLKIKDKTMIESVVSALTVPPVEQVALIVNPTTQDAIKKVLKDKVNYITQYEQKGTGHAVMCAESWLNNFTGSVLVFVGDAPFITQDMVTQLIETHNENKNTCTMFSAVFENEIPVYGRIIRDRNGKLVKIIEEKDATEEQKKVREVNTSHYCFDCQKLYSALKKTSDQNAQNEYYLSDVIEIFLNENEKVEAIPVKHPFFTYGINTLEELNGRMVELNKYLDRNNG